jgi:hypothetical protein
LLDGPPGTTMSFSLFPESPVLWHYRNGSQEAYCLLQPHPIGQELRYIFNDVQLIGVVSPDADELRQRAEQWRVRLVAEGWDEVQFDSPSVVHARTVATRH